MDQQLWSQNGGKLVGGYPRKPLDKLKHNLYSVTMTVKELIEHLQTKPQHLRVVIPGYEEGVKDITRIDEKNVVLNVNSEWYFGPHEVVEGDVEHSVEALKLG